MKNFIWTICCLSSLVLVGGCKQRSASGLKVTNGKAVVEETDITRPIVKLFSGNGICTGTFITPTVIVTAAHCIKEPLAPTGNIKIEGVGDSVGVKVHPQYAARDAERKRLAAAAAAASSEQRVGLTNKWSAYVRKDLLEVDVAYVIVRESDSQKLGITQFYKIAHNRQVLPGDRLQIIGFGVSEYNNDGTPVKNTVGVKRSGFAVVQAVDEVAVRILGYGQSKAVQDAQALPGEEVSIGGGDSGGPWIRCESAEAAETGACASFEIVALSNSGGFKLLSGATGNGVLLRENAEF